MWWSSDKRVLVVAMNFFFLIRTGQQKWKLRIERESICCWCARAPSDNTVACSRLGAKLAMSCEWFFFLWQKLGGGLRGHGKISRGRVFSRNIFFCARWTYICVPSFLCLCVFREDNSTMWNMCKKVWRARLLQPWAVSKGSAAQTWECRQINRLRKLYSPPSKRQHVAGSRALFWT